MRFKAFTRPPKKDEPPLPPGAGAARLTRVNTVFMLMDNYAPGRRAFRWTGTLALTPNGDAEILPFCTMSCPCRSWVRCTFGRYWTPLPVAAL